MSLQIPEAILLDRNQPCALCQCEASPRQLSHIIPSFVFKHASVRSPTGYLRNSITPNRRIQDGPKDYVLCRKCEQLFSGWERSFAETYRKFYTSPSSPIKYTSDDAMCVLSILWRILHNARSHPELNHLTFGNDYSRTDDAFRAWSSSLMEHNNPGKFRVYWLFFDRILSGNKIPDGINTFIFHSTHFDLMANGKESFAYAHIPGMFIFGMTEPHDASAWRDLRVRFNGGIYRHQNRTIPGVIGDLINQKLAYSQKAKSEISPVQQKKISDAALSDPEKLMASPLTQSVFADRSLRPDKY